jgi:alkylated DNA repair dioxygenase AlkB
MKFFINSQPRPCVQTIEKQGIVCIPRLLEEHERQLLLEELRDYRLVRQADEEGPYKVKQNFSSVEEFPPRSRFLALRDGLQRQLQALFDIAQEGWETRILIKPLSFNELVVQTYQPTVLGISPHRDGLSRINLIAILVLEGRGRFGLCDDRAGTNPRAIRNEPGDLLLMRAPGFLGGSIRPFHFVDRVEERRSTFALRQQEVRT